MEAPTEAVPVKKVLEKSPKQTNLRINCPQKIPRFLIPGANSTVAAEKTPSSTREKTPKRKAEFSLGHDLHALKRKIKEAADDAPAQESSSEELLQYQINPSIHIDEKNFREILNRYIKEQRDQTRMNLASALQEAEHTLVHNCWKCTVGSELQRGLIEKDRTSVLPYLRKNLSPEFFLELEVDDRLEAQRPHVPYTNEEKLKVMVEKNPSPAKTSRNIWGENYLLNQAFLLIISSNSCFFHKKCLQLCIVWKTYYFHSINILLIG